MLGDIEHAHVGGGRLGSDDELVLRHVPRAVDLSVMVDFDRHLHLEKDAHNLITKMFDDDYNKRENLHTELYYIYKASKRASNECDASIPR